MKPPKAMEILACLLQEGPQYPLDDRREALMLGIEALHFFIEFQKVTGNRQDARLPSETKEG